MKEVKSLANESSLMELMKSVETEVVNADVNNNKLQTAFVKNQEQYILCKDEFEKQSILYTLNKCNDLIVDLKTKYVLIGGCLVCLENNCKSIWSERKGRPCKNIYELAEHCFNFPKTTTANVIGVAKRFGAYYSCLKTEYENYSFSQLCEMLPLSDEQLNLVTCDMSVQEIRALKKAVKKVVPTSEQKSDVLINKGIEQTLTLKNDTERLDFLKYYKHWGLWLELKELNLRFYKCDLNNGDFIVVTECPRFKIESTYYGEQYNCAYNDKFGSDDYNFFKCIVKKGTSPKSYGYDHIGIGDTAYLSYMKSTKAKPIIPVVCSSLSEYIKQIKGESENV